MEGLQKRFGRLVAAHRRRHGWTQRTLAEKAELSEDMISRIEAGTTGASFSSIDALASAFGVDPAELFTTEIPGGALERRTLNEVVAQLTPLTDRDLKWLSGLISAALKPRN